MMADYTRSVRAFRPSRFSVTEDQDELVEATKATNLKRYRMRAEAGLPLFSSEPQDSTWNETRA